MPGAVTVVLSGLFASCTAVGVTFAIEKLGPVLGGVIGAMPSTIIPAAVGFALSASNADALLNSLYTFPVGMLLNVLFLMCWKELPGRWPIASLHDFRHKLAAIVCISLALWIVTGTVLWVVADAFRGAGLPVRVIGLIPVVLIIAVTIFALCQRAVPPAAAKNRVTLCVYLSRGVLAGVVIAVSVVIAAFSETAGGLAAAFPAIFLTTMVSLWVSQGPAVQGGAVLPLMTGSLSVVTFALLFAEFQVAIRNADPNAGFAAASPTPDPDGALWAAAGAGGVIGSVLGAFAVAVCCITVPAFFLLRALARHRDRMTAMAAAHADTASADTADTAAGDHSNAVAIEMTAAPNADAGTNADAVTTGVAALVGPTDTRSDGDTTHANGRADPSTPRDIGTERASVGANGRIPALSSSSPRTPGGGETKELAATAVARASAARPFA